MLAKWLGRKNSPLLLPDTATRFFDENVGRCPNSPFEPGLLAVLHQRPDFDFTTLDLITDRYTLSCLLELANGNPSKFSFGAQVIGGYDGGSDGTFVFVSTEPPNTQKITKFKGYRQDFMK